MIERRAQCLPYIATATVNKRKSKMEGTACCFVELTISSSASYPSTSHSVSATGLPVNGSSFDNNKQVVSTTVTNDTDSSELALLNLLTRLAS